VTAYPEFRLRIDRGLSAGTYRVVATGSSGEALGRFKLPFSDLELENFVLKVGRTRRGKRRVESPEMELAKDFGGKLFSSLFDGDVKELFRSSYDEARSENHALRITLSLTGAPELSQVPWEYMYDHPKFLSTSTMTPIVRYLDLPKPRRPLQIALPLRILGVVSAPSDAEPIDVAAEKAKLGQALAPLVQTGSLAIDWLETATLRALQRQLRQEDYHVLHYIGHGGYDRDADDGVVLFEDELGRSRRITGVQLGTILQDEVSLRLAVLNACEGGRTSVEDPFSGVATSLIEREIPAVIGMQFEITDRSAIVFASEFYAALADGFPVDSAMAEARKAIYADENDVEWATPVLFMRVQDGLLFEVPEHASARDQKPAPEVAIAAAKAEADAVKAGADAETAAAAATVAALAATPPATAADASERGEPLAVGQAPVDDNEAVPDAEAVPDQERLEAEATAAAERERLRLEVEDAREREREAVAERDRLAAEAEAARLEEEQRRRQDAEHAAEHERASAAEKSRHEEEERLRTETAAAAAAEAAAEAERLETQRVWIAGEVERLKSERRSLESELRQQRDATAGQIDPMAGWSADAASADQASAWTGSAMGSSKATGQAAASPSKSAKTPSAKAPAMPGEWMATRQSPNRGAAAGRGFLGEILLVAGYVGLFVVAVQSPWEKPSSEWGSWFERVMSPVLSAALIAVVVAVVLGILVEQLVPPLRAPARDRSRWITVLILGLTIGPVAFVVGYSARYNELAAVESAGEPKWAALFTISAIAFLLAEQWMGRGTASTTAR
jgi:hypothetical protein